MITLIGIIVIIAGMICWIGQSLSFFAPVIAVKLGLCEPENDMDHTLYIIETRAHGLTDILLTWILPLSALLMLLNHPVWPILALVGGGVYLYFPGIIILHRVFLKKQGLKVGKPSAQAGTYIFGTIWLLSSVTMIALAIMALNK
jgi:hypothetical protein